MSKALRIGLGVLLVATGCASQAQFLDGKQAMAMQTAVSRGQFEMNCAAATGTIISREVVQPALQGPFVGGIQRAEYTIGVAGCEKRTIFVVVCPDGGKDALPLVPAGFTIGSDDTPGRHRGRRAPPALTMAGPRGV